METPKLADLMDVLALRRWPTLEPIDALGYRGSMRTPAEIFQAGFKPQLLSPPISIGEDGHTWLDGADSESQVVSVTLRTSTATGHYAAGGYLYAMHVNEGIDLRENGDYEIAMLGVESTSIIAAVGKLADRQTTGAGRDDTQLYAGGPLAFVGKDDAVRYFENPNCNLPAEDTSFCQSLAETAGGCRAER